ncbi:class I SAM-dependent methyltransferase [Solidesulfovibrio sp.]
MITTDGRARYNIWEHSATLRELYARRCRQEAEEMTCHAQAVELLAPHVVAGDTLLDAGCGSGYLYHALKRRNIAVDYLGVDASPSLLDIGRSLLPAHGLDASRLVTAELEDLHGAVDHVVCLNVLSNLDNYHRPLDRLSRLARKTLILRESLAEQGAYAYVRDDYLDAGCDLWVHVNTYPRADVLAFLAARGFAARLVTDRRTGGRPESVIGYPHHWTFIEAWRPCTHDTSSSAPA